LQKNILPVQEREVWPRKQLGRSLSQRYSSCCSRTAISRAFSTSRSWSADINSPVLEDKDA